MTLIDTIRGALGLSVPTLQAPADEAPPPPPTPSESEPLTSVTVASLRAMLDEHDRGTFLRSALLCDLMRRDADVAGALLQRLLAFQALDTQAQGPDDSDASQTAAARYLIERPALVSLHAQLDLVLDGALLGFGVGQLTPFWDEATKRIVRRLEPWPASAVEYDRHERRWYAVTLERGRVPITPGDGQWVLYTPRGARAPWLWGAVRCASEWYLRDSDAAADASRHAEVFGSAIWKAKLPSGARQTPDGKAFVGSLRTMGRNAVIPVPRGKDDASSYDVDLVEAKADAHAIFEWLMRTGGGRIRLALLGQDLTSQNNTVGTNASSETGMTTLDRIVRAEGLAWATCETRQIAAPWALYEGVTPAPRVLVKGADVDDRKVDAEAQTATANAVTAWQALGVDVDVAAMAARARIPVRTV